MSEDCGSWYLVYTKPQQERTALSNLERQGYTAFLPLMRHRRRSRGRLVEVVEPMFPRYLFVRLNTTTDNWKPIQSTLGVSNLVRFGLEPARMPSDLVELLQSRVGGDGVLVVEGVKPKVGDRVRIGSGAFEGYEGIMHASSGKGRVTLLLEVVGRTTRIELHEGDVDPIS